MTAPTRAKPSAQAASSEPGEHEGHAGQHGQHGAGEPDDDEDDGGNLEDEGVHGGLRGCYRGVQTGGCGPMLSYEAGSPVPPVR